jgi:hypothetical protein
MRIHLLRFAVRWTEVRMLDAYATEDLPAVRAGRGTASAHTLTP